MQMGDYLNGRLRWRAQQAYIDQLKRKFDAGATGAIPQLFFDNRHRLRTNHHACRHVPRALKLGGGTTTL